MGDGDRRQAWVFWWGMQAYVMPAVPSFQLRPASSYGGWEEVDDEQNKEVIRFGSSS